MPETAGREGALEIGLRRSVIWRRVAILVVFGAAFAFGPVYLLASVRLGDADRLDLALKAMLASPWIMLGGLGLLVAAYDAVRVVRLSGCVLRVDADGVFDRRVQSRMLPWSAVRRVEIRTIRGRPALLGFWARRMSYYRKWAPVWNYFGLVRVLQLMAWRFRFAPLSIDLQSLDVAPETVIAAVRQHWGEPECRPIDPDADDVEEADAAVD